MSIFHLNLVCIHNVWSKLTFNFQNDNKNAKDIYSTQSSGITPRSQINQKPLKNGARNTWRKLKFPSKVWHLTIQKGIQWSGIWKITWFNHSLMTNRIQQFEPCIKHHKLIHSYLITYTYICVQCLSRRRSLDHTMTKQKNKIYSIQGRELTQKSSWTRRFTISKKNITLEIFLLTQTHFMSRACFHQVIHLIKSDLCFSTRFVFAHLIKSNPCLSTKLSFFNLFLGF